ncbi:glutamine-rich protein 2 [Leptinotarsa decemlineata]|uniref:glutamine-rich protein 2 n=1 Tax=Leptinotarsa decemlineata TaxID=7539 RepID=UPI003D3084E5
MNYKLPTVNLYKPKKLLDVSCLDEFKLSSPESQPADVQIKILESKIEDFYEQIHSLDSGFGRQVNVLQNRISDLEKQLGEMMEKVHLMPEEVDTRPNHITSELHGQLVTLQDEFTVVSETVQKLAEDYSSKEHTIDILVEQIELLKTVKADREDLEDALADKADACQINRKVSFEQFDQACGDMSKSLEEALAKLSQQELLWNQALDNIQNSIGGKLDKVELNPLRDFINNKLKGLQEKFKTLNAMKRENEAAGTKSKYLKNVNCISCDKDVVMRKEMDPTLYPKPYAVPPSRSMGPYLAYELDQLRKQQKCLPSSKNMNTFENALQTSRSAKSPDHVCNRYCGGSHTVTTPQQRVTRLGHFLEQWGPEIAPVEDTHVRGTDGRMYKARDDQQLKQLASERPPTPHADKPAVYITLQKTDKSDREEDIPWPAVNQPSPGRISGQTNATNRSLVPKSDSLTKTTEPAS